MQFIDTHCHLYLPEFKDDLPDIFRRASEAGVKKFYFPAIDSSFTNDILILEQQNPGKCFAMTGLHPCSVNENYITELNNIKSALQQRSFVAIGEIGLDFYWSTQFVAQQYEVFDIQMQWASDKNLPIVIHTRKAMQETIDAVKPFAEKGLRGIFHCFGDTVEYAHAIIEMGFLLGIGGVLTYKNSGLNKVIEQIDLKHIVLETDAPYLTPIPFRGKRNESSYIKIIAEKLAAIKNISLEEVATVTTANAEKIFGTAN